MDLRYPVGQFVPEGDLTPARRQPLIDSIADAPRQLRLVVEGLTGEQFDTPYRPEGWTVRQVVHHMADSHLNSYVRFHWALTESEPLIKAYDEKAWAELPDGRDADPAVSLALLEALHRRWAILLRALAPEQFGRTLRHPENGLVTLDTMLALYAWHGRHHIAHVANLRQRMNW